MSTTKLSAYGNSDAMISDDALDSIIRQAIGKESLLSFSRDSDTPVQWIQLLHALDQQGSNKVCRDSNVENCIEEKEKSLELYNRTRSFTSEMNVVNEFDHNLKVMGNPLKGTKSTSEQLQNLKIPEAVVAFAQAAAKANGEPEKYLPGWPLLSPPKVQLQKCDKCSLEFCSTINYRRHTRVHRRSLNIVKDSSKMREFLGGFWDKLTTDEAKKLVSFENVALEELTGSSVIRALSSWVCKPGFSSLPHTYVKAGMTLLDIIQAKPSRFPITSQALFSALDDASEKTFLCFGTALSVKKYVFDGEVGKNALEMKNLIACTSFLLEQILVKAWVADKDAEALRCQKLLVEEEEAAQKRQAELLERKRLKKLRQKEQKANELDGEKVDPDITSPDNDEGFSVSTGTQSSGLSSEFELISLEASLNQDSSSLGPIGPMDPDCEADIGQTQSVTARRIYSRRPLLKHNRKFVNSFHSGPSSSKTYGVVNLGNYRDAKAITVTNGQKIWTPKSKPETEEEGTNEKEMKEEPVLFDKKEVMIGSMAVALGDSNLHYDETASRVDSAEEKMVKLDSSQAPVKLWRPISRHGNGDLAGALSDKRDGVPADYISAKMDKDCMEGCEDSALVHTSTNLPKPCLFSREAAEAFLALSDKRDGVPADYISAKMDKDCMERCEDSALVHTSTNLPKPCLFSREAAEAFLAQRWKEAIAGDHVKLVLSPELNSDCPDTLQVVQSNSRPKSSDRSARNILVSTENRMPGVGSVEAVSTCASKKKFKAKTEKSYKLKYVPKQRSKE